MIKVQITEEQHNNLRILADFLKRHIPPPNFSMRSYMDVRAEMRFHKLNPSGYASSATNELYNDCGTVACAVGHGPLAGIKPLDRETWSNYARRVFGPYVNGNFPNQMVFEYLFGSGWERIDNTPQGAAARIEFYLENGGVPQTTFEEMRGSTPLSYTKFLEKDQTQNV